MSIYNGNVKPFWWGPKVWCSIFSFVAVYPDKPDNQIIEAAKAYFNSFKYSLPCEGCRYSYNNYLTEHNTNINDNKHYLSRNALIEFVYNIRNKVNNKLNLDYCISLEYFKKKLQYMVCETGDNCDGYVMDLQEVPFIPRNLELDVYRFLGRKTQYNIEESKQILKTCRIFMDKPNFDPNDNYFKLFYKRTTSCRDIIKNIYMNMCYGDYSMVDSFTKDFKLHLKLLYMGCTIIPEEDLVDLISGKKN
jgi:hypothetical protein